MISYQEAIQLVLQHQPCQSSFRIDLEHALGYKLAQPVVADRDYPPFNRSAMDGIAINHIDYKNGLRKFHVLETIYAGEKATHTLSCGGCYKIMTGAAVPQTASAVIRLEDLIAVSENAYAVHNNDIKLNENTALKGQDLLRGTAIINDGMTITPSIISLLATFGIHRPMVKRPLSVGLFTTGNEVISIYKTPNETQIRNSNRYLLDSLLRKNGVEAIHKEHLSDDFDHIYNSLSNHLNHDIIIVNAGISVGEKDYVPEVLHKLGAKRLFHKVAIKPGKPIWCGTLPSGGIIFGLPGNPFSCLVTFTLFVQPLLHSSIISPLRLPLKTNRKGKTKLDEFFPVRLLRQKGVLEPVPINGSGDVRLGLMSDGIALHPSGYTDLNAMNEIDFYAF